MGITRLRKTGLFPIDAFAVISEPEMIPLCEKYDIGYCVYKNEPLGEKKNFGISKALEREWDYLVEIGSDDVLKNEYLELLPKYLGHDFVGIDHFVFMNSEDGCCRRYQTKTSFGLGRMLSRKAVIQTGNLWNDKLMRGLDNYSTFKLSAKGFLEKRMKSPVPVAIDIKSSVNIWKFNYLIGQDYTLEETLAGLSTEEVDAIMSLHATVER